jgi:hypothetical protein
LAACLCFACCAFRSFALALLTISAATTESMGC